MLNTCIANIIETLNKKFPIYKSKNNAVLENIMFDINQCLKQNFTSLSKKELIIEAQKLLTFFSIIVLIQHSETCRHSDTYTALSKFLCSNRPMRIDMLYHLMMNIAFVLIDCAKFYKNNPLLSCNILSQTQILQDITSQKIRLHKSQVRTCLRSSNINAKTFIEWRTASLLLDAVLYLRNNIKMICSKEIIKRSHFFDYESDLRHDSFYKELEAMNEIINTKISQYIRDSITRN